LFPNEITPHFEQPFMKPILYILRQLDFFIKAPHLCVIMPLPLPRLGCIEQPWKLFFFYLSWGFGIGVTEGNQVSWQGLCSWRIWWFWKHKSVPCWKISETSLVCVIILWFFLLLFTINYSRLICVGFSYMRITCHPIPFLVRFTNLPKYFCMLLK
jgi:hypothetical protein